MNDSPFWKAVRELAALRVHIPEERRALSGVKRFFERGARKCEMTTKPRDRMESRMSDIFNPPPSPDFTEVECPECGTLRTKPCHVDAKYPSCNGRQYLWYSIKRIEELRAAWAPDGKAASDYVDGWNDAIEVICERLKGSKAL